MDDETNRKRENGQNEKRGLLFSQCEQWLFESFPILFFLVDLVVG